MHPSAARPTCTIDALDRIVFVNEAWVRFQRSLCDAAVTVDTAVGRPLWDFIEGVQVRQLWKVLYERVRAVGAPAFVPMRADTPQLRRVIDVELHPLPERAIQHIYECAWTEARLAVALLDPAWPRDDDKALLRCAWCSRIQVRLGAWEEVEDAQLTLHLEGAGPLPALKTGVCAGCKQSLLKTFPARVA